MTSCAILVRDRETWLLAGPIHRNLPHRHADKDEDNMNVNEELVGSHVCVVFRHVFGASGHVIRSKIRAIFSDPDHADEMRLTWNREDDDFESLVQEMYAVCKQGGKDSGHAMGDMESPRPEWLAAGRLCVEDWIEERELSEDIVKRLLTHDSSLRTGHYVDWIPLVRPGMDIPDMAGGVMQHPPAPMPAGKEAVRRRKATARAKGPGVNER